VFGDIGTSPLYTLRECIHTAGGAAITTADLNVSANGVLVVFYVAIASVLVWAPTVIFVLFGNRVVARLKQAQEDVARRQPHVTVYALLILAAALTIDALGVLLL